MATVGRRTKSAAPPSANASKPVVSWINLVEDDGKPSTLLWRLADAVYFYLRSTYPGFQGIDAQSYSWLLHVVSLEPDASIAARVNNFARYLNDIGVEYRIVHRESQHIPTLGRRAWVALLTWEVRVVPIYAYKWWKRLIARLPLEDPQSRRPFPAHPPRTFYPAHGDKTLRQTAANFAAILQTNEAEHSSSHHGTDDSTRPTGTVSRDRARRTEAQNPFADSAAVSWDATAQTLSRTRERKAVPSTSDPSAQTLSRTANPERARAPVPAAPGALRAPLPSREQASRRTVAMDQQPPAPRSPNPERAPPANTLRAPGPLGDQTPAAHSVPPLVPPARSPNLERARPSSPLTASTLRPPLPQRDHRSRHTVALDDMERHVDDVLRSRRSPPVPQARPPVPPPPAVHEEPLRTRSTPPARSAEPERTRPPVPPVPSALRTSPGDAARPPVPPRPHALRPALAPREHASRHTVSMSHDFVVVPPPLAIVTEPPPPRIRAVASQPMLVPTIVPPTPVDSPVSPASLPLPLSPHSRRSASFSDARVAYNPFVQLMAGQRSPDGEMVPSFESLQLAPAPRRAVSS